MEKKVEEPTVILGEEAPKELTEEEKAAQQQAQLAQQQALQSEEKVLSREFVVTFFKSFGYDVDDQRRQSDFYDKQQFKVQVDNFQSDMTQKIKTEEQELMRALDYFATDDPLARAYPAEADGKLKMTLEAAVKSQVSFSIEELRRAIILSGVAEEEVDRLLCNLGVDLKNDATMTASDFADLLFRE